MTYAVAEPQQRRNLGKWAAAFALFWAMLALIAAVQLYQMTAPDVAKPALERATAALSEIDPLLDRNYDDLRERAEASAPGDTLKLRDFPVDVPLSREEVLSSSREELRRTLLARATDVMYSDGTSALRDGDGPGRFSAPGLVDGFLGFLRNDVHDMLGVLTIVLAFGCVLGAATLAWLCSGYGRLGGVGAVLLAASLPVLAAGGIARLYAMSAGDDTEFIQRELLAIAEELSWIPIRNGVAFAAFGAGLAAIAALLARVAGDSEHSDGPAPLR